MLLLYICIFGEGSGLTLDELELNGVPYTGIVTLEGAPTGGNDQIDLVAYWLDDDLPAVIGVYDLWLKISGTTTTKTYDGDDWRCKIQTLFFTGVHQGGGTSTITETTTASMFGTTAQTWSPTSPGDLQMMFMSCGIGSTGSVTYTSTSSASMYSPGNESQTGSGAKRLFMHWSGETDGSITGDFDTSDATLYWTGMIGVAIAASTGGGCTLVTGNAVTDDDFTQNTAAQQLTGSHTLSNGQTAGRALIMWFACVSESNTLPVVTTNYPTYNSTEATGVVTATSNTNDGTITGVAWWGDDDLPATGGTYTYDCRTTMGSTGDCTLAMYLVEATNVWQRWDPSLNIKIEKNRGTSAWDDISEASGSHYGATPPSQTLGNPANQESTGHGTTAQDIGAWAGANGKHFGQLRFLSNVCGYNASTSGTCNASAGTELVNSWFGETQTAADTFTIGNIVTDSTNGNNPGDLTLSFDISLSTASGTNRCLFILWGAGDSNTTGSPHSYLSTPSVQSGNNYTANVMAIENEDGASDAVSMGAIYWDDADLPASSGAITVDVPIDAIGTGRMIAWGVAYECRNVDQTTPVAETDSAPGLGTTQIDSDLILTDEGNQVFGGACGGNDAAASNQFNTAVGTEDDDAVTASGGDRMLHGACHGATIQFNRSVARDAEAYVLWSANASTSSTPQPGIIWGLAYSAAYDVNVSNALSEASNESVALGGMFLENIGGYDGIYFDKNLTNQQYATDSISHGGGNFFINSTNGGLQG